MLTSTQSHRNHLQLVTESVDDFLKHLESSDDVEIVDSAQKVTAATGSSSGLTDLQKGKCKVL